MAREPQPLPLTVDVRVLGQIMRSCISLVSHYVVPRFRTAAGEPTTCSTHAQHHEILHRFSFSLCCSKVWFGMRILLRMWSGGVEAVP
jgi:hypothetical protein